MRDHRWGADVPISRPRSNSDSPSIVNMGGLGFGEGGITFHLTDADIETVMSPFFHPRPFTEYEERP